MKGQNKEKQNLDRIGRKLLASQVVSGDEIEKIVSSPKLFDSIVARIKAEQSENEAKIPTVNRWILSVGNKQKIAAAFAVLTFFIICSLNWIIPTRQELIVQTSQNHVANEIQMQKEPIETKPDFQNRESSDVPVKNVKFVEKPARNIEQATYKIQKARQLKYINKAVSHKKLPVTEIKSVAKFYALTYTGDLENAKEDLQIVRTEMTPASLFALGVNYPIENEKSKIKTDLLVGQDGIARAIRFID